MTDKQFKTLIYVLMQMTACFASILMKDEDNYAKGIENIKSTWKNLP